MRKNTTLILSTVLVGAGAFLIYNRSRKAKKGVSVDEIEAKQKTDSEIAAEAAAREAARNKYNSLENPNSYKSKVARVQAFLGVAIDGIVGPQTLGALKQKLPKYQTINSSNIDFILGDIFALQNYVQFK
jgi:murein L,D-transpeptidase YcbB/YkuD